MLLLQCTIEIDLTPAKTIKISRVNAVHIESSWKNLVDKCTAKIPSKWLINGEPVDLRSIIKKEMPIRVFLGYAQRFMRLEFSGTISTVKASFPMEIQAEDSMRLLKKVPVNVSYKSISLEQFLKNHLPKDIAYNVPSVELGTVKFIKMNLAKCLEEIKKVYGLVPYFKNGILYIGRIYSNAPSVEATYFMNTKLEKGVNLVKKSQLDIRDAEDYKVKVTIRNHLRNGKVIEASEGDANGEVIETLPMRNEKYKTKEDLSTYLKANLEKYKKTGLQGELITFGSPAIWHSDIVVIKDGLRPAGDGRYFIESIVIDYDSNGFQRKAKLGQKVP